MTDIDHNETPGDTGETGTDSGGEVCAEVATVVITAKSQKRIQARVGSPCCMRRPYQEKPESRRVSK